MRPVARRGGTEEAASADTLPKPGTRGQLSFLGRESPDFLYPEGRSSVGFRRTALLPSAPCSRELERSCLQGFKEGERNSPGKGSGLVDLRTVRTWKCRHIRVPGGKCHQPLDKAESERKMSATENGQGLPTFRLRGVLECRKPRTVNQGPRPVSALLGE
ncbi:Aurora kinase A and ninein-interacting protein [Sciurus carolinensis]|uniref:Aurora kinase A and ninein-interacting protein n=1 Tax=Sciurus carolinensis TaxID=30640 RepID=A0AA41MM03_SCICA|nr:Aurora kinase A and ninein-interacting protein [Sciurus carolinensis]